MSVEFDGLEELQQALRNLPEELAQEAGDIVVAATNDAAKAVFDAYPEGPTGHLKGGVRFKIQKSQFGVIGTVSSNAPHAWMFENGTQARHTELGANRGAMPPAHVFIPIVAAKRRQMDQDLVQVLVKAGAEVSGDVDGR